MGAYRERYWSGRRSKRAAPYDRNTQAVSQVWVPAMILVSTQLCMALCLVLVWAYMVTRRVQRMWVQAEVVLSELERHRRHRRRYEAGC
jgi:hypothetical protein